MTLPSWRPGHGAESPHVRQIYGRLHHSLSPQSVVGVGQRASSQEHDKKSRLRRSARAPTCPLEPPPLARSTPLGSHPPWLRPRTSVRYDQWFRLVPEFLKRNLCASGRL